MVHIILMNLIINRAVKSTNWGTKFWCSRNVCRYPYKFGGIQSKPNDYQLQNFVRQKFGSNVIDGFKQAYLAVLHALKDKDKTLLLQTMEPNLTNALQFQQVQLVNETSNVKVNVGSLYLALGCQFKRTAQNRKVISYSKPQNVEFKQQNYDIFVNEHMFQKNSLPSRMADIPLLMGLEVYFESNLKLIRNNDRKSAGSIQHHMIQFEISNKFNPLTLFKLAYQNPEIMKGQVSNEKLQKLTHEIFPILIGNYEWKISDMDRLLNRNFTINYQKIPGL